MDAGGVDEAFQFSGEELGAIGDDARVPVGVTSGEAFQAVLGGLVAVACRGEVAGAFAGLRLLDDLVDGEEFRVRRLGADPERDRGKQQPERESFHRLDGIRRLRRPARGKARPGLGPDAGSPGRMRAG